MKTSAFLLSAVGALALAACAEPAETDDDVAAVESAAATTDDSAMADASGAPPVATGTPVPPAASGKVLALEGLGDLVIGQPVPAGSRFAERGAQINEACRTVSSPDYPGVYAIVENDQVRRITVGERSDVKMMEGVGVGATQADVLAAFPGFRSTPHKYVSAPGKYLTQPGNDPRLRFEIGETGRVTLIHAGLMPQLGYVEGCA
jgi:hypothetical protein